MIKNGELVKHPAGMYFQNIPIDPITKLSAIPYKQADEIGYFKIDLLHLSVLDYFENKEEIRQLIKIEPDWSLLLDKQNVEKLFQIHKHYDIVYQIQPKSITTLADTIALLRPAKRNLISNYIKFPEKVKPFLYTKPTDGKYYFKKSHAIAYSLTIVLQMHLISGNVM